MNTQPVDSSASAPSTETETLPTLYLIAHKVRGQPAFDIAHRLQVGDEEGWIIPTSGHRAYPYWYERLAGILRLHRHEWEEHLVGPMPPDWPDHYAARSAPSTSKPDPRSLLASLGLLKPAAPINRRV